MLNTTVSNATRKQMARDRAQGKQQKEEKDNTIWDALGVHCSANERRADEASRDVEAWLKCYYMKDKLGEVFHGVVSGVTPFGIFVQLEEMYVEGLVHVTGLGTDYFQYDEARHELRGERTGQVYQLTSQVTVQVARVDLESRKIDLVLAQPEQVASVPAPLERARVAALEAMEPKPPRRRKAKANAGAEAAPMPVSPQEARGTPAEPPAASFDGENDVVFVPPTRRSKAAARSAAKKTVGKKPATQQESDSRRSANKNVTKNVTKAPKAATKTSRKSSK
jgi:ribonuclease R